MSEWQSIETAPKDGTTTPDSAAAKLLTMLALSPRDASAWVWTEGQSDEIVVAVAPWIDRRRLQVPARFEGYTVHVIERQDAIAAN